MKTEAVRTTEGKYRTSREVKEKATEIYSRWGLSLSDAINVFLVKSVDVGGLPFSMARNSPSFETLSTHAYKAPLDSNGIAILPRDWADDE